MARCSNGTGGVPVPPPWASWCCPGARVLLPAMKGLQDEAARLAGADDALGRYRFGGVNSPILGRLVHRLAAEQPHAQITTYASWSADELAALVAGGRLDFALTGICGDASPPAEFGLSWREVAVDPVLVLLPAAHPMADRDEVGLGDLRHEQWVAAPGDGCFGDCFAAACARAGFTPARCTRPTCVAAWTWSMPVRRWPCARPPSARSPAW